MNEQSNTIVFENHRANLNNASQVTYVKTDYQYIQDIVVGTMSLGFPGPSGKSFGSVTLQYTDQSRSELPLVQAYLRNTSTNPIDNTATYPIPTFIGNTFMGFDLTCSIKNSVGLKSCTISIICDPNFFGDIFAGITFLVTVYLFGSQPLIT